MDVFSKTSQKPTVLIVDDEPLVRTTIADMLRLGGFDVLEAATADQGLAVLANGQAVAARERHPHAAHGWGGLLTSGARDTSRDAHCLGIGRGVPRRCAPTLRNALHLQAAKITRIDRDSFSSHSRSPPIAVCLWLPRRRPHLQSRPFRSRSPSPLPPRHRHHPSKLKSLFRGRR